jgi:hypothetical protein
MSIRDDLNLNQTWRVLSVLWTLVVRVGFAPLVVVLLFSLSVAYLMGVINK